MASKKSKPNFAEVIRLIKKSGLNESALLKVDLTEIPLTELNERIKEVLNIFENKRKTHEMIFFLMYDIENNKVRNHIAKYLIREGCIRVQKSVFIANKPRTVFDQIHETLREVQDMYDNEDSIFILPVSTDEIHSMKVIGKSVSFDMITEQKNTLIF